MSCSELQCVAVVLQCVIVCCSCVALCCIVSQSALLRASSRHTCTDAGPSDVHAHGSDMLQCIAVCCSVLQCLQCVSVFCSVLQCVVLFCSVLEWVTVCVAASPCHLTYMCPWTATAIADPQLLYRKKLVDKREKKHSKLKGAKRDHNVLVPSESEEDKTKTEAEKVRKKEESDRAFAELMEEENQTAAAGKKKQIAKEGKERRKKAAEEERKMKAQEEDKEAEKTKLEVCRVLEYRR